MHPTSTNQGEIRHPLNQEDFIESMKKLKEYETEMFQVRNRLNDIMVNYIELKKDCKRHCEINDIIEKNGSYYANDILIM